MGRRHDSWLKTRAPKNRYKFRYQVAFVKLEGKYSSSQQQFVSPATFGPLREPIRILIPPVPTSLLYDKLFYLTDNTISHSTLHLCILSAKNSYQISRFAMTPKTVINFSFDSRYS